MCCVNDYHFDICIGGTRKKTQIYSKETLPDSVFCVHGTFRVCALSKRLGDPEIVLQRIPCAVFYWVYFKSIIDRLIQQQPDAGPPGQTNESV